MKNNIMFYFFGAGPIIEEHIKSFKGEKGVELFAILSRTKSKAIKLQKKYKIKFIYNSFENLKKNKIKKVAVIGVSILSSLEVCKKIFQFFDYCLIEKPPGYNYKESLKILKLSKKYNVKVYVALNRRCYPSTDQLRKLLKKDRGNRIINIIDHENIDLQKNKPIKVINNWMYANSIHLIDYANIFCRGKKISIKHFNLSKSLDRVCIIKFSSGDICIYQGIWNKPGPWGITVSTKTKYFQLQPLETLSFRSTDSYKMNIFNYNAKNKKFKHGFKEQAKNFLSAIQNKKHQLANIEEAVKTMKLIKNIYNK